MEQRVSSLRKAVQKAGAGKKAALPVAYIENSSHCTGDSVVSWCPMIQAWLSNYRQAHECLPFACVCRGLHGAAGE